MVCFLVDLWYPCLSSRVDLVCLIMKPQVAVGLGARKKKMRQKLRMRECKIKKKETNCGWGVSPA